MREIRGALPLFVLAIALSLSGCDNRASAQQPVPQNEESAPPQAALPKPARVADDANILDPAFRQNIAGRLDAFERATAHQMVVVTVTSLGGTDIADYTRELGNRWGVGRKGRDDGIVILVAPNERKARIAVGRGLEKALPDSLCTQIMKEEMIPRFAKGDFAGGIDAGTAALIKALPVGG